LSNKKIIYYFVNYTNLKGEIMVVGSVWFAVLLPILLSMINLLLMPGGYAFPGKNKNSTDDYDYWQNKRDTKMLAGVLNSSTT
jgi:hypothetical protein